MDSLAAPPTPTSPSHPLFLFPLLPLFLHFLFTAFVWARLLWIQAHIYKNIYVKMYTFLYFHAYVNTKLVYLASVGLDSYKGTTAMCIKWKVLFTFQKGQLHWRHKLRFLLLCHRKQAELIFFISRCLERNGSSHPPTSTVPINLVTSAWEQELFLTSCKRLSTPSSTPPAPQPWHSSAISFVEAKTFQERLALLALRKLPDKGPSGFHGAGGGIVQSRCSLKNNNKRKKTIKF